MIFLNVIPVEVKQKCVELSKSGLTSRQVYTQYYSLYCDTKFEAFRTMLKRWKKIFSYEPITPQEDSPTKASQQKVEYKSDGTSTFEGIISLMEDAPITPDIIMQAHNLDAEKWSVVSYKTNFWQTQAKDGVKLLLYQSKITVKPKLQEVSLDSIDTYFENKDYSKNKLPIDCFEYDPNGEILDIKIPDLHIGLLAWHEETGEDYDLKIAKQHFLYVYQ